MRIFQNTTAVAQELKITKKFWNYIFRFSVCNNRQKILYENVTYDKKRVVQYKICKFSNIKNFKFLCKCHGCAFGCVSLRTLYSDWKQLSYFNGSFSIVLLCRLFAPLFPLLFFPSLVFSLVTRNSLDRSIACQFSSLSPCEVFLTIIFKSWNHPRYIRSAKSFPLYTLEISFLLLFHLLLTLRFSIEPCSLTLLSVRLLAVMLDSFVKNLTLVLFRFIQKSHCVPLSLWIKMQNYMIF